MKLTGDKSIVLFQRNRVKPSIMYQNERFSIVINKLQLFIRFNTSFFSPWCHRKSPVEFELQDAITRCPLGRKHFPGQ